MSKGSVAHVMAVGAALALAACNGCQPSQAPSGTPLSDQQVYDVLVAGKCLAASDGGVAAVAAEHASPNPAWLNCLYNGGTVAGCQVPCN